MKRPFPWKKMDHGSQDRCWLSPGRQSAASSWATTIQSAFILLIKKKKRNCEAVFPSKCSKIPHSLAFYSLCRSLGWMPSVWPNDLTKTSSAGFPASSVIHQVGEYVFHYWCSTHLHSHRNHHRISTPQTDENMNDQLTDLVTKWTGSTHSGLFSL